MNIVFKTSDNVRKKMIEFYIDKRKDKVPPYAVFQAMEADTIITLYESGKAMFQGVSADVDAQIWIDMEKQLNNRDIEIKEKEKKEKEIKDLSYFNYSAIGSDEVGTGDYFLPIVVTATFVSKENIEFLTDLKIQDSKKMTDKNILSVAPILMKKIPYSTVTLTNQEYNDLKNKDINMNKIKAILHNKVLFNLVKEKHPFEKIIVDQFCLPVLYFKYLKDTTPIIKNIIFLTKAEDKNLSVACAAVISRYIFLQYNEKLNKMYDTVFPKGAGIQVDKKGIELVNKYGKDILNKISKITFKNTEKILDNF